MNKHVKRNRYLYIESIKYDTLAEVAITLLKLLIETRAPKAEDKMLLMYAAAPVSVLS